jgi:anti-sigma B factor antagonist
MIVSDSRQNGVLHLHLMGCDALDCANAAQVRSDALKLVDGTSDIVVDLSHVSFVDSAGVSVLVSLFKAARARDRKVKFVSNQPGVVSVLELIKLDQIFDIYPDRSAAVQSLRGRRPGL